MGTKIANIISFILHPLFIPTYALLLLFNLNFYVSFLIPYSSKLLIVGNIFILTFIFPLLSIFVFLKTGVIKTLQMETKEERTFPFLIITVFYYLTYYLLRQLHFPQIIYLFILGAVILAIISLIINIWWKISIHMVGMGAFLGVFLILSLKLMINIHFLILLLILLSGLVGFSRLKLNMHSSAQVYVGFFVGLLIMLFPFLFL